MDRPASYLLHKYLKDPNYLNLVKGEKEKQRESFVAMSSGMN